MRPWLSLGLLVVICTCFSVSVGSLADGERQFDRIREFSQDVNQQDDEFFITIAVLVQEHNAINLKGSLASLKQMVDEQSLEKVRNNVRDNIETQRSQAGRSAPFQMPLQDIQILIVPVLEASEDPISVNTWSASSQRMLDGTVESFQHLFSQTSRPSHLPSVQVVFSSPLDHCLRPENAIVSKEPQEQEEKGCESKVKNLIKKKKVGKIECGRPHLIEGFAAAANWALDRSKGMYALFLTDDVVVENSKTFLESLIKQLDHPLENQEALSSLQREWREYHRLLDEHLFHPTSQTPPPQMPDSLAGTGLVSCNVLTGTQKQHDIGLEFKRISSEEDIVRSPDLRKILHNRFSTDSEDQVQVDQPFVWFPFPRLKGVEQQRKEAKSFQHVEATSHFCWMAPRLLLSQAGNIADPVLYRTSRSLKWTTSQRQAPNHLEPFHFSVIDLAMRLKVHGWSVGWVPESRVLIRDESPRTFADEVRGLKSNAFGRNHDPDAEESQRLESFLQKYEAQMFLSRWIWLIEWTRAESLQPKLDLFYSLSPQDPRPEEKGDEELRDVWKKWKRWQKMRVVWRSECGTGQVLGFTMEALTIVLELDPFVPISMVNNDVPSCTDSLQDLMGLPDWQAVSLDRISKQKWQQWSDYILILHHDPGRYEAFLNNHFSSKPSYVIGRSMYETNNIPEDWIEPLRNQIDELWVPSVFNLWTFGVSLGIPSANLSAIASRSVPSVSFDPASLERDDLSANVQGQHQQHNPKIFVMPEAVDVHVFDPDIDHPLLDLDTTEGTFRFVSVMKWEDRKNWKALIKAFLSAFSPSERVTLTIRSSMDQGNYGSLERYLIELVKETHQEEGDKEQIQFDGEECFEEDQREIEIIDRPLKMAELASLYQQSDCFVLPTHGEGWGLPIIEAMAMQLPTIATNWSGSVQFLNDENAFPIPVQGLEEGPRADHKWAKVSLDDLKRLMRHVYDQKPDAGKKAERAKKDVDRFFSQEAVAQQYLARIGEIFDHFDERKKDFDDRKQRTTPPPQENESIFNGRGYQRSHGMNSRESPVVVHTQPADQFVENGVTRHRIKIIP